MLVKALLLVWLYIYRTFKYNLTIFLYIRTSKQDFLDLIDPDAINLVIEFMMVTMIYACMIGRFYNPLRLKSCRKNNNLTAYSWAHPFWITKTLNTSSKNVKHRNINYLNSCQKNIYKIMLKKRSLYGFFKTKI